jgi:hypothetical protein
VKQEFGILLEWAQREHERHLVRFDEYGKNSDHLCRYMKMSGSLIEVRQPERKTVLSKM